MVAIRIIRDVERAKRTVLRRVAFQEVALPEEVRMRSRDLFGRELSPEEIVAEILQDVRQEGDAALRRYTELLDGARLGDLRVSAEEQEKALQEVAPDLKEALEVAAERIRAFHQEERHSSWLRWEEGSALGQMIRPLERIGIYAPGGRAAYPSSLLMAAVLARVAGIKEIVVCTPPGGDGRVTSSILAAAEVSGVDAVFKLGGAQAIAALAYGTQSVPKVDKVFGPGNIFVMLAKRMVYGAVDIDQLPGPTETLIIADGQANPELVAADLLAQAEHDPMASAILLTPSPELAEAVQTEVEAQLAGLSRREIVQESLDARGGIVLVQSLEEAIELANSFAPEHLCLLTAHPWELIGQIVNAGGIFLGESSPEVLGDYVAGPSHIMPTGGTARFASPLHIRDFLKVTSLFALGEEDVCSLGPTAIALAEAEGLTAHAAAIRRRLHSCAEETK